MKILIGVKRVVDANVKVRVKPDNSDVEIQFSKMSINPFDENAIEEAITLKESGIATEIIALSIGSEKACDTLRSALARGCDRAILVNTQDLPLEPLMVAKIFKQIVKQEKPDLVLLGKQAIDDDANQVGQMLAGMLDYPQGTFISKLTVDNDEIIVVREIDNGTETLALKLPAIVTTDLHLNTPRFVTLPQLMHAKKKPITTATLASLGLEYISTTKIINAQDGEIKKNCTFIHSVDELVGILKKP